MQPFLEALMRKVKAASREQLEDWLFQSRLNERDDDSAVRCWAMIFGGACEETLEGRDPARFLTEIAEITEEFMVRGGEALIEETSAWLKDQHGLA